MKLRIVSDLHLELDPYYRLPYFDKEKETILILAGDICRLDKIDLFIPFFEDVVFRFRKVLYVFGNHEFYRSKMDKAIKVFHDHVKSKYNNIEFAADGNQVIIDDVTFLMATLWTGWDHPQKVLHSSNEFSMEFCRANMGDFFVITDKDGNLFTPKKSKELHTEHFNFIKNGLKNLKTERVVIITHHSPSLKSICNKYWKNPMNPAFSSDLSKEISKYKPDLWIHGHMHNCFDYLDNEKTRIICNPHGYPGENPSFNPTFVLDF